MKNPAQAVLEILRIELRLMLEALKLDTPQNYRKKANNFLLSQFDPDVIFYTVFTSSFESKSGNAMENCAKAIARITYGEQAVPSVVRGLGAREEDVAGHPLLDKNKQIVLTRKSLNDVTQHASRTLSAHRSASRGSLKHIHFGLTQSLLQTEIIGHRYDDGDALIAKPVDLFIFVPEGTSLCLEVKLGGDLDSSNAPAQIAKLLAICAVADVHALEGYFATIYNKNGKGRRFTGVVTSYLAPDMILAGREFWAKILPTGIDFEDFVRLYHQAMKEIGMNDAIRDMVETLVPVPRPKQDEIIDELIG